LELPRFAGLERRIIVTCRTGGFLLDRFTLDIRKRQLEFKIAAGPLSVIRYGAVDGGHSVIQKILGGLNPAGRELDVLKVSGFFHPGSGPCSLLWPAAASRKRRNGKDSDGRRRQAPQRRVHQ